jgi:CheY-like chemotaxis protein
VPSNNKTVLVIENDHDCRVYIRRILEDAGFFVVSATNGFDAMVLLEKISIPSVILLDTEIPLTNIQQFLESLKINSKYASIPIVQMSSSSAKQVLKTNCVVTKPFNDPSSLLRAIKNY